MEGGGERDAATYLLTHLANNDQRVSALNPLLQLHLLVVENVVAHIPQHALDLKLGPAPCGGEDLARDLLLVLGLLLVSPGLATLLLKLGHLLHGELRIDGGAHRVPGIFDQRTLVLDAREEARDAEEFLGFEE